MDKDIQRRIRDKISKIEEKSAFGNYIYRGEPKDYGEVSSSLWRDYKINIEAFDIEVVQAVMLNGAKRHIGELPQDFSGKSREFLNVIQVDDPNDFEILTEIQHYGGKTNLIDFTTDYFIALFFACNGHYNKKGRVILQNFGEIENMINHPQNPRHRVVAQKSVFVRPPKGFIVPHEDDIVTIPADLKPWIIQHLRQYHGISTETIYNDVYGYIRNQHIHGNAYTAFYRGFAFQKRGDDATTSKEKQQSYKEAINYYTKATQWKSDFVEAYYNLGMVFAIIGNYDEAIAHYDITIGFSPNDADTYNERGISYYKLDDYEKAISDYTKAIQLNPNWADVYYNRGVAWLLLSEWEKSKSDLMAAEEKGANIIDLFRNDYTSIADFQSSTGITLPPNIAKMLTTPQS